jgi:WXG100 family type VII secretion target
MTLDGLRVNHAGLDTVADDLGQAVTRIDERLDRLESELAPLRSDWTGSAQQAYTAAKMKDLLHETSTAVTQSNAEYRAADQRGAASFGA